MTKTDDFELDFTPKRSLQIDCEKWQGYLDDPTLSQEQKEQIITSIWQIMMAFVDLGFEVHPVQEACGQVGSSLDLEGKTDSNESKPLDLSTTFNAVAP